MSAPGDGASPQRWLLISVSLTAGQASLRVHVWRKLRSLGAVYLQASVCLLPERPEVVQQARRLADRVRHKGGTARVLQVQLPETGEEQALREEFNTARDTEYAEVLERIPALSAEIAMERARGRATYAEVEESEADLERFRSWLAKIAARDYFAAPGGERAQAAVAAVTEELAAFEAEALNAEAPNHRRTGTAIGVHQPGQSGRRARTPPVSTVRNTHDDPTGRMSRVS